MKILVVDDSITNITLITNYLEKLGHVVIPVTDSEKTIKAFQDNLPDLVILDVVMDKMDGFECARRLRAITQTENWIPIIFLSGNMDDESLKQGIDAGGDDYLTKPFSEVTLAAKIKAMQRIADMRNKLVEMTRKLALLSSTDFLTGAYNRFQFDKTIVEKTFSADRYGNSMALLFIDLDNFKSVNDSFGHNVGDALLKEVTNRLRSCLRLDDFVARIGGDEFAVIISHAEMNDPVEMIAQKILDILSADFYLENHNIRISVSIGIACYPFPGTTQDNIVKHADIAMYHAKSLGRNNYQYYKLSLNEKYKKQIDMEYALKFAVERKEISLTYQPIFDIQNDEISGLEVLICWNHPTLGIVPPNIFIPIAEESGLISSIGNWVIRTTCEQAAKWQLKDLKNFKIAINLSPQQLSQIDFIQSLIDIVKENEISPSILEFEITETAVMSYRADIYNSVIENAHHLGISIAIDDFGTGYSSLKRLKNLKIDALKIDKIFIKDIINDPNSAIIINCLITLGENLGLKVIAEGIETNEQLLFLKNKGCRYAQGFLLSRPLTPDKVPLFLNKLIRT